MKLWKSDKYIPFFGHRFYYKKWFMRKIAKPLKLPIYKKWRKEKNKKKHDFDKRMGRKANPNWAKNIRKQLEERNGCVCAHCTQMSTLLQVDHIVPLHAGGGNELSNTQLLCEKCHVEKTKLENKLKNYAQRKQDASSTG